MRAIALLAFRKAGFDQDMIGYKRIERSALRWKKAYKETGGAGLIDSRKDESGRSLKRELSNSELIEKQKGRIMLLEAEVELLNKIDLKPCVHADFIVLLTLFYDEISLFLLSAKLQNVPYLFVNFLGKFD